MVLILRQRFNLGHIVSILYYLGITLPYDASVDTSCPFASREGLVSCRAL